MAEELCKYLPAFKSLGFEWIVYEKTCTYHFDSFLKKTPMITNKTCIETENMSNEWIY